MYIPKKFQQDNIKELVATMRQYPFATVVLHTDEGLEAFHLPVIVEQEDERLFLQAHIAKANSIWKKVQSGAEVLVIFNGPNCYVSPNHYPTKAEHGRAVPTWDYVVVHVKGSLSFIHDPDRIYTIIDKLTTEHEAASVQPWSMSDAPADYIQKMLPAIVGVEIEVNSRVGQWKLSQNQPDVNQQGVVDGLISLDTPESKNIAALVKAQMKTSNMND
ncbi:FMN-binding negative transcriptional regulator [Vibrio sp.]|uniref:FMN-binding negative transcriptional regulator n=1 Tax=Vibrio sp. TaxID=678 RepID=UPI003D0C4F10